MKHLLDFAYMGRKFSHVDHDGQLVTREFRNCLFILMIAAWITMLWLPALAHGQQLTKTFYIDSLHVSNTNSFECGNSSNPCTTVQDALNYFASDSYNLIQHQISTSNTSTLTIQLTFFMLNDEHNFCGYNLNTTFNDNIDYELSFIGNGVSTLTCTKGYGELNFIESRLDISKVLFSQLSLIGVVFNSCSSISLTVVNCSITDGGFMTYYQLQECPNYVASNRTIRNLYLSNISTWNGVFLIGNAKNGLIENIRCDGVSALSFNNMESIQLSNVQMPGDGLFSSNNVNSISFKNFISTGPTFNIHIREFKSFTMESSSFQNYKYFQSAVNIDRGESAKIIDTTVQYSSQWLSAKTVKKIVISNLRFLNNYVLDVRTSFLSPIFIYSCDSIKIENSYFDGNFGTRSGPVFIDDYLNVEVSNNTFMNGRSLASGGALHLDNYQAESLLEKATVLIKDNLFLNNTCERVGGAVCINTVVNCVVTGNKFIRNQAVVTGGALTIVEHCRDCLIESYFEENKSIGNYLELDSNIVFSQQLWNRIIGTGGALAIFTEPRFSFRIYGSVFVRNYAGKGGAILMGLNLPISLSQKTPTFVQDCKFEGNFATKTGNDIYAVNFQAPLSYVRTLINQTEGNEYSFSSSPAIFRIVKVSTNKVYPGQPIDIAFYVENIFGREIDIASQYVVIDQFPNMLPFLNYSNVDRKSLVLTPYSLTTEMPIVSQFNFSVYSEDQKFSASFQFEMFPCPKKFILQKNVAYSNLVYQCVSDNSLDLSLVLGLTIPIGILFLIVGAVLGGLSVYAIRFTLTQISILKTKQRAEKSLEQRIIDKKIIFNSDPSSGTTHYSKYSTNSDLSVPLIENGSAEKSMATPSFVIPIESIDIIKKLAEGGLGIIYLGKLWKKIDVAIKLLKSNDQDEEFEQEVSLLSSLRHDNIVTFYGICMSDDAKYMITEFVEKGSLDKALYKSRIGEVSMSIQKKMSILIATARGIEYLHGLTPTVVHRDLKPGNILLEEKNQAKICDFGISRTVSNATVQQTAMTTNLGTLIYCPNEVIEGPTLTNKASKQTATKIDIFSFSVIMWEVFFEIIPYSPSVGKLTPLFQLSKEENEMLSMNSFNIPYFVVKGMRPLIPFRTDEQIREWIERYMPEQIHNSNIVQFVNRFFALVQQGWSTDATKRPNITTVLQELEELNNLIR